MTDIKMREVYAVNGECFDEPDDAIDALRQRLADVETMLADDNRVGLPNGTITWGIEVVPFSHFDELVSTYGDNPHGGETEWAIDREQRYLLVEENVRGGYWLTSGDDAADLIDYHVNQEYAHEWEVVGLYDTETGEEVNYTTKTTVEIT